MDRTNLGLLRLLSLLVVLSLGDSRLPRLETSSSGLVPLGGDRGQVGSSDGTGVLDGLPRPLLGDLLGDTLLVVSAVELGPGDLTRVLALKEEGCAFGGGESEDLRGLWVG